MKIKEKEFYIMDVILITITLMVLVIIGGYATPLVIAPADKLETTNNSILFSFEKANAILIDDNLNFTSPEKIYVKDNLVINLMPGIYYWKIEGILKESEVRELTIKSEVNLKLKEAGEKIEVVNAGNTILNVDIYDKKIYTGSVVLGIGEAENVSGTKFIGKEDEN